MSRAVLGGVVAAVIVVLTAAAYFVATSNLEDRIRQDVKVRVVKAQELLIQNSLLEGLGLLKRAEALARDHRFVRALQGDREGHANPLLAEEAFAGFRAELSPDEPRPDILSLVSAKGEVVALVSKDKPVTNPIPDLYLRDGKLAYRAIELALASSVDERQIISEIWDYENAGPMKAAVAPVVDVDFGEVVGAVVIAYPVTAVEAARQRELLGAEVTYFHGDRVHASSLGGRSQSDRQEALRKPLFESGLARGALESQGGFADLVTIELDGQEHLATAGRLPRFSTRPDRLPDDYPPVVAGAMVSMSVTDALAPLTTVKIVIVLLGLAALLVALMAMMVTSKTILGPLDEIEVGINEIINGNLDRTFRPGSADVEGLANALNVMLARLLGRPEPGDEQYDDDGNIIGTGAALEFDPDELSPRDAEAMELAREPEAAYYERLHAEYVAARKSAGESVEGISHDSFVAKLRLNEANLKNRYQCRAVRFKVVAKDGKVTLKPVPIA